MITNVADGDALKERALKALQSLPELASGNDILAHAGRYVSLEFLVSIGGHPCFVTVDEGRVVKVETDAQKMRASTFTIAAEPDAWDRFWQAMPAPGWNDLFAMNKRGNATIEGNLLPFMQNLQFFKDVMALPRQTWAVK